MWQHLADLPGGSVAGLVDAGAHVFAATPAGIRRSADGGQTWSIAGLSTPVPFASVVATSPDRSVVYGGSRDGVYRSTDGGATWAHVLGGGNVLGLAVPSRDVVFAGTEVDGILRSDDGGRTWAGANPGLLDLTILALGLSPRFEHDRLAFAATASGVYRTRNGGRSWRAVDLGSEDVAVQALALSPAVDGLLLAGTEERGILRSTDGGDTWQTVEALHDQGVSALSFAADGTLAAATEAGVAVSADGGATWRALGADLGAVLSLAWLGDGSVLAGLADGGVARSTDRGATWRVTGADLRARLVVSLTSIGSTLCAGDLQAGVIVSRDAGATWQQVDVAPVHALASTPSGSLFAASANGLLRSQDAGATWQAVPATPPGPVRAVAASTRVVAAFADETLLASDDDGQTWTALAPRPNVVALALSAEGIVFAASASAGEVELWRSADLKTWQRWLVAPSSAEVVPLAVLPTYAIDGALLVGLNGRVMHPARGSQEVRGGERRPIWHPALLGDGTLQVTALVISPNYAADRTVLAATSGGVFVSRDAGATFSAWSEGLAPTSVVSLAYPEGEHIYALGLGGTVWRRQAP